MDLSTLKKEKIYGLPLGVFVVFSSIILLATYTGKLSKDYVGTIAFLMVIGGTFFYVGGKIPIVNDYMGGATVLRGVMGYGANSRIHTAKITDLSSDLPILIEVVDSPEHIAAFLPFAEEMVGEGMITLDEVSVVKYGRKPPREKGV